MTADEHPMGLYVAVNDTTSGSLPLWYNDCVTLYQVRRDEIYTSKRNMRIEETNCESEN